MAVSITFTDEPPGVIGVFTGTISGQDIISFNNDISHCKECTFQLTDFRNIDKATVSLSQLHMIAIQDCSIPEEYRIEKMAIVGDANKYKWLIDTYYLFIEAWIGKRREYASMTFSDINEAYNWVGLSFEE